MTLLRRALGAGALVSVGLAAALLLVPGWLVGTVLGQADPPGDFVYHCMRACHIRLFAKVILLLRRYVWARSIPVVRHAGEIGVLSEFMRMCALRGCF